MAGAFTHMAIVSEALNHFPASNELGKLLRSNRQFLTLGSVSPDIPYLSHLAQDNIADAISSSDFSWADIMHYHNTNGIVNNGLHSLAASKKKDNTWKLQFAWLLGFTSHLVADATIHPIVESIVGPYTNPNNVSPHRECEMVQDVLVMDEVMNLELSSSEYSNLLEDAISHSHFSKVAEFWATLAKINSPFLLHFDVEKIIASYKLEIDLAEGGNILARAFRHLGSGFIYRTKTNLKRNAKDLIAKYYTEVNLPNGRSGDFRKDGFDYAVSNLVQVWSRMYQFVYTSNNIANIIPNWNLDTGIDQNTQQCTYWS